MTTATATATKPRDKTFFTIKATSAGVSVTPTKPTMATLSDALEVVRAAKGMPGLTTAGSAGQWLELFIRQCNGEAIPEDELPATI